MANKINILSRLSPLLLLIFLDSFSFFVVIPILLKLFYHAHYDLLPVSTNLATRDALTGIVISLAMLSALIAAPLVGSASDKYGRKKTLLFCLFCVAMGFLFPIIGIVEKNIYFIFIGRMISGIGSASQPVAQATVADVCKQEDKAIFLGSIALMMTLALILGPLAGGYLSDAHNVSWFNSKTPFEFALILSAINVLLILFFFKETMPFNERSKIFSAWEVITGLPKFIKRYHVGILILLFFCLEVGWSQYYQSISLFLHQQFHFTAEKIGLFSANMGIIMAMGLLIIYPILLRVFSINNIMRFSMLLVLMGLSFCAVFSVPNIQWIFSSVVALFTGIAYVSLTTLISNKVPDDAQGFSMGYLSAILYFSWMLTSLVSGFLMAVHQTLPLFVAAFALFIGCLSLARQ